MEEKSCNDCGMSEFDDDYTNIERCECCGEFVCEDCYFLGHENDSCRLYDNIIPNEGTPW